MRPLMITTQNTITHNNQHEPPPPYLPAVPLPLWVGQRRPQHMVPWPHTHVFPFEATVVGFGGAMVGLLVWGVPNSTRHKIERRMFLGCKWVRTNEKTQQPAGNR
jgi:hypothetical protein